MKIATWNIGGGFISPNNDLVFNLENIEYFIMQLKELAPDVICFQEIHVSDNNNQPQIIANALGFSYYITESIAESHVKAGEKLSISILSKYPIISSKFNKLTNPNLEFVWNGNLAHSHDKGFLEAIIDYNGKMIRVLSGHLVPLRKFAKNILEPEFQIMRDEIKEIIARENLPTVIGADMNCEEIDALLPFGYRMILNNDPTTPKGRHYDKIVLSDNLSAQDSEVIPGQADHYLCLANINDAR